MPTKRSKEQIAQDKLLKATQLFESLELKIKEKRPLDNNELSLLSKKERILYLSSKSYVEALENKDKLILTNSCTAMYKIFNFKGYKFPALAEKIKKRARIFYQKYLATPEPPPVQKTQQIEFSF
jgi:hypothetical protein